MPPGDPLDYVRVIGPLRYLNKGSRPQRDPIELAERAGDATGAKFVILERRVEAGGQRGASGSGTS